MSLPSKKRPPGETGDLSPPPLKRKIAATTTNKAVANFFKPSSEKEPEETSFRTVNDSLLVVRHKNAQTIPRSKPLKVAAFDLDGTLITTKSGLKFARDHDDWKWWHPSIPTRLKQLHNDGHAIIVLSNQAALSLRSDPKALNGMRSLSNFKGKASAVLKSLDLPVSVYAATEYDIYRKPRVGMWEQVLKDYGLVEGDVARGSSIYVGDAAGRADDKAAGVKKDHSCSDRDLAANVSLPFMTPEEFFLRQDPKPFTRAFDPEAYFETLVDSNTEATPVLFQKTNKLDLVLFCGSPGAGKSTFYWNHLKPLGYERVNQDTLKSRDKCIKVATGFLDDGDSVVVDNTNADIETRAAWIALARKMKVPVRLVLFTASAKLCEHNDAVRALGGALVRTLVRKEVNEASVNEPSESAPNLLDQETMLTYTRLQMNPESRTMLPKVAFSSFAGRYREPKIEEGFQDITKVDFTFEGTEEQKALWRKYWIS